jgi:ATP-dependent RNA helicase SUPV3L1/SUV3
MVDDIIESDEKRKLKDYLEKWLEKKIKFVLKSLIDLKSLKEKNSSIRALAYQLYENNGVIKREMVSSYLNKLGQDERKILRNLGVKFGRYHVFLFKLLKPDSVLLRILLWKNYNQKYFNINPPKFGLNFIENTYTKNKNFMLLCGFENFDKYFVRIDILERLFVQIINTNKEHKDKNKEVKLIPEMLNLLGCSKENFKKLIKKMDYKTIDKAGEIYFKYNPVKNKKTFKKISNTNSPFKILKNMNFN